MKTVSQGLHTVLLDVCDRHLKVKRAYNYITYGLTWIRKYNCEKKNIKTFKLLQHFTCTAWLICGLRSCQCCEPELCIWIVLALSSLQRSLSDLRAGAVPVNWKLNKAMSSCDRFLSRRHCRRVSHEEQCADAALERRQPVAGFRPTLHFWGLQRWTIYRKYHVSAVNNYGNMFYIVSQTTDTNAAVLNLPGKHPEQNVLRLQHWLVVVYRIAVTAAINAADNLHFAPSLDMDWKPDPINLIPFCRLS